MKSKRAREAAVSAEGKHAVGVAAEESPAKKRKSDGDVKAAKDKKDKKESRKERKDKKKDIQNLPEEDEAEPMAVEVAAPPASEKNGGDKKKTKANKAKKNGDDAAEANGHAKGAEEVIPKTKKDGKDKKEKVDAASEEQQRDEAHKDDADGEKKKKQKGRKENEDEKEKEDKKEKRDKEKKDKKEKNYKKDKVNGADDANTATDEAEKADRHIVFVGNLPYSATTASITAHFGSLNPASVRCLTKRENGGNKDGGACRGIAFVEFADVWSQRTCLDRFHHSLFDDGKSPARKINVELTAGGGGKTKHRTDKIRAKNEKLDENRAKRIEREKSAKDDSGANKKQQQPLDDQQQGMGDSIHPSRLARNPGLGH